MARTRDTAEPMYELAHLGHAELLTPAYDESLAFFTDVYGLDLVHEASGSAYLRAWGDHDLITLKLTAWGMDVPDSFQSYATPALP